MSNILLGYGIKIPSIDIFNPIQLMNLFNIQIEELSPEELENMEDEEILDILTYSEGIHLQLILEKIASQSNIIQCIYNGVNHCLVYPAMLSWNISQSLLNLQPSDIEDEIEFLLKPLLKEKYSSLPIKEQCQPIFYENI